MTPTVPCETCGTPTPFTGTRRCENCWGVESRLPTYLKSHKAKHDLAKLLHARPTIIVVGRLGDLIVQQGDVTLLEVSCWPRLLVDAVRAGAYTGADEARLHGATFQVARGIETMLRHLGLNVVGVEVRT